MTPEQITEFLAYAEDHKRVIAASGMCAQIVGYLQFAEAIRLGHKHKTHAIPFFVLLFYFAYDATFVSMFHRWFDIINHPMLKNSWFTEFPFPFLQLIVGYQLIKYSRDEVFPGSTMVQAIVGYAVCQIAMLLFFNWLRLALDDYTMSIGGMLTIIGSNMNIYLLTRRRSRKGQSMYYAWLMVFGAGPINWFLLFPNYDARLNTPAFYAFGAAMCVLNFAYVYFLSKAPKYAPATEQSFAAQAAGSQKHQMTKNPCVPSRAS